MVPTLDFLLLQYIIGHYLFACNAMLPRASPYSQIHSRNLKTALGWSYSLLCSHSPLSIAHPPSHKLLSRRSDCQVQWSSKHASTLASSTAINATKEIPTRVQELYDRLTTVKDNAASYVSLSRLQLALRGLETENPVVRIAGWSLNSCCKPLP